MHSPKRNHSFWSAYGHGKRKIHWDSLAEALQKGGYKQEAAKNYRIVLQKLATIHGLDPKIRARYKTNAKKQLRALE